MKKLALSLIFALVAAGAMAQDKPPAGDSANKTAGGSATGAGATSGISAFTATSLAVITIGILLAGATASGGDSSSATNH